MNKKLFSKLSDIRWYIAAVLLLSWIVEVLLMINPEVGLKYFSLTMAIPAITTFIFKKLNKSEGEKVSNAKSSKKAIGFSLLYPIIFVFIGAVVTCSFGIGKFNLSKLTSLNVIILLVNTIIGLVGAFGEEYGWRGYLLPQLTKTVGKIKATVIVGVVWALFHVPAVFLLARATGMSNPILVTLIQAAVVFVFSFSFSYCYYLSGRLLPVVIYHSFWNTINTAILGDIYVNRQGVIEGNVMLINGEGFMGLILGALAIYWFIKQFKKDNNLAY